MPNSLSLAFVEGLYADYVNDPASVPSDWKEYFESLAHEAPQTWHQGPSFKPRSLFNPVVAPQNGAGNGAAKRATTNGANGQARYTAADVTEAAVRQDRVDQLVRAYRVRGHMIASVDPLGLPRAHQPELLIEGDQAKIEGFVVKGVEGDAVALIQTVGLGLAPGDDVRGH